MSVRKPPSGDFSCAEESRPEGMDKEKPGLRGN